MNTRIGILAFALTLSLHAMEDTSPRRPSEGKEEVDLPSALAACTEASSHSSALALGSHPYAWPERVRNLTPAQRQKFTERFATEIADSPERTMTDFAVAMRMMQALDRAEHDRSGDRAPSRQPSARKKLTELMKLKHYFFTPIDSAIFIPNQNKIMRTERTVGAIFGQRLGDGRHIVSFDTRSGEMFPNWKWVDGYAHIAINNEGTLAAVADKNFIHLLDMDSDRMTAEFQHNFSRPNSVAFNAQENFIVSATGGGLCIYDSRSKKYIRHMSDRSGSLFQTLYSAQFNPHDDKEVIAASNDSSVPVWDVRTGKTRLHLHTERPSANPKTIFNPQGDLIAATTSDGVCIFNAQTGREVRKIRIPYGQDEVRIPGKDYTVNDISFSPDGDLLAVAYNKNVELFDVETGYSRGIIDHGLNQWSTTSFGRLFFASEPETFPTINSARFNPNDGSQLVTAANDGTARIWKIEDEKPEEPEIPEPKKPDPEFYNENLEEID